jgi:hypothetical protein
MLMPQLPVEISAMGFKQRIIASVLGVLEAQSHIQTFTLFLLGSLRYLMLRGLPALAIPPNQQSSRD